MYFKDFEEDELFGGTPQKKYFDILFTANRNLVEDHITTNLERIAAMELLMEEMMGEDKDIEKIVRNFVVMNQEKIDNRMMDLYINGMGDIVTRNE